MSKNIINEYPRGSAVTSSSSGSSAYSVYNIPNFYKRNRYTRINTNVNLNGTAYLYLTQCNGVESLHGAFPGEDAGLASYISAVTTISGPPFSTTWTCHKAGIFNIDVSVVLDRQSVLALYGIGLEVNGVTTDWRCSTSNVHDLIEEWSMHISCTLAMKPNDYFKIPLTFNQPLDQLWEEPSTVRLTQLNIIQLA